MDIGGGSTEFVFGTPEADARHGLAAISVNIGCVRLTERHLHDDPPAMEQVAAAARDIDAALATVAESIPVASARTLVGLAGSVTTLTAVALNLAAYDPARIHHARISAGRVHEVTVSLLSQGHAQRAASPVIHPGRVDVIAAGALILDRIMDRFGFTELVTSEHDILDGIAWSSRHGARREPRAAVSVPGGADGSGRRRPARRQDLSGRPVPAWPGDPATAATPVATDADSVRSLAAGAGSLAELTARQSVCRACPRLVSWREQVAVDQAAGVRGPALLGPPGPRLGRRAAWRADRRAGACRARRKQDRPDLHR